MTTSNSFGSRAQLKAAGRTFEIFRLDALERRGLAVSRLPYSLRILLENLLRREDGQAVRVEEIEKLARWDPKKTPDDEIAFMPARVLMQDFTGVPAVVDVAAMRDAMQGMGGDPKTVNPLLPAELVIDHSVIVDEFGTPTAFQVNADLEFQRNRERYALLRWAQQTFRGFRVVPPDTGIVHQVNLEYLARVVFTTEGRDAQAYPDTLVGTDSHTTMINGLGVLGWGVGGIEAEAAMLGQPVSMLIPQVVGFRLTGKLAEGATATDLVLTITQMLRRRGVVGRFVEYCGPGCAELALADRATIGNMSPEYGATCGFFPIDAETIRYLTLTARDPARVNLVEAYAKVQGLWRDANTPDPVFTDLLELDLGTVEPSLAGPRRPQDRVSLSGAGKGFDAELPRLTGTSDMRSAKVPGTNYDLHDGDIVIAAITSCTNTSNPSVMLGAGLLAKKAVEKGLKAKPWVKTSLAPGSQVVSDYYAASGLQEYLDKVGFNLVGYGCTTCIGNSGPLPEPVSEAIDEGDLAVCAVLSGNRNFEGRIHAQVRANYLASPPLVVAYALAGTIRTDLTKDPLGEGGDGKPVYLRDIWPSNREVADTVAHSVSRDSFQRRYGNVFEGPPEWREIRGAGGLTYNFDDRSTYLALAPYFENMPKEPVAVSDVIGARELAIFGDSITTDHISPAGSIKTESPAGEYLISYQVRPSEFNTYGARRGNHHVMTRGTFANIRIRNEMVPGVEGGMTKLMPDGTVMPIYDAAMEYKKRGVPLVVFGGKEYGTGSSRDWAAKGTLLLGVKAVIVESFERIHRSNLVGMGVLPLQFKEGTTRQTLKLDGDEVLDITGVADGLRPRKELVLRIRDASGSVREEPVICRIDTLDELEYYRHGGILQYVLRSLLKEAT